MGNNSYVKYSSLLYIINVGLATYKPCNWYRRKIEQCDDFYRLDVILNTSLLLHESAPYHYPWGYLHIIWMLRTSCVVANDAERPRSAQAVLGMEIIGILIKFFTVKLYFNHSYFTCDMWESAIFYVVLRANSTTQNSTFVTKYFSWCIVKSEIQINSQLSYYK